MNPNSIMVDLAHNAALLLAIALVFDITMRHWEMEKFSFRQVLVGFVVGGIGIILMMTPWQFVPGIIFDTRSILLSISGLFLGFIPTLIAVLMTAAFRIYQGGAATLMGVSVIAATSSLGLIWRSMRKKNLIHITFFELYIFGLVNHVVMLLLSFTLPFDTALSVLAQIALPVIIIYPLGTALLGELLTNRLRREKLIIDLHASEERLRLAVEASHTGFFERNFVSGEALYSKEWKRQIGYAEDELPDETQEWEQRLHPDDQALVLEKVNACIQGVSKQYDAEYRLQHKDGSYRWILARGEVHCDREGNPLRLIGCHIDISNLKQTQAALAESHEKYRLLTENIKDVVWVLDTETFCFTYMSPSVERLRGYTAEEVMAHPIDFAIMPDKGNWARDIVFKRKTQFLEGEFGSDHFFTTEIEQPCKDGSTVWTDVLTSYYINPKTRHVEVLGVTHDISERRAAQEEVTRLNAELETRVAERTRELKRANEELSSFAYSISHDLRAPLRAIDGFSHILVEDHAKDLDDSARRLISRLRENAVIMANLIAGLLEFSRKGSQELHFQPVDLQILVRQVLDDMKYEYPDHPAHVKVGELPECTADPVVIKQVFQNLIHNAFKFTTKTDHPLIEIGSKINQKEVVYYVKDNGVGFDMTYAHERLFNVFQRMHRMDEFEGTGVGLAIAQRIIHRHGGEIWAESTPNQGTTFTFTIPGIFPIEED